MYFVSLSTWLSFRHAKLTAGGEGRVRIQAIECVSFSSFFSPSYSFSIFSRSNAHTHTNKEGAKTPGAPLTYFNDGGLRQRFIFYTQKNPNFRICLPKKIPTFFSIPKKIPQCFCISKFYYLSSGKLKHANYNFGFGQK